MKRKLSLLAITMPFSLIGWASINLKTEPKSILPVWSQTAGSLRFTVDGPDFIFLTEDNPHYLRIQLRGSFLLAEELVTPQYDPKLRQPINLALRLECDDGSTLIAPPDAVQIVRWKYCEEAIWLRVNHSGLWVQLPSGKRIAPDMEHPVIFEIGVAWEQSESLNRTAFSIQCANIPFNQNAYGEGVHTFLRVGPNDEVRYDRLLIDARVFDLCRGVESVELASEILLGDSTPTYFWGDDIIAFIVDKPRQYFTHVPSIFNYESDLILVNQNPRTESVDINAVTGFGVVFAKSVDVGPMEIKRIYPFDLFDFSYFFIDSYSLSSNSGVQSAVNIWDWAGLNLTQPSPVDWGRREHRLRIHHRDGEFHGLALFGLEQGTPVFLDLLDDENHLIKQFTIFKYLAPGARQLLVLDVFTEAFTEASWAHIRAQQPIGLDSLVGSTMAPSHLRRLLTPSHAIARSTNSTKTQLVPRINDGMVVHAYNFDAFEGSVVYEGFDSAGVSLGILTQPIEGRTSDAIELDAAFPDWAYVEPRPEDGVALGYGLSANDAVLKRTAAVICKAFVLLDQRNRVSYRLHVINLSEEAGAIDLHHEGPIGDWWETLPAVAAGASLSFVVEADFWEKLTFVSDQPWAVTVTHQSDDQTLVSSPLVLERPLFEDLGDVDDDILKLLLLNQFDRDGNGVLCPAEVANARTLDCSGVNIHSLNGLARLGALESLVASRNALDRLPDLSGLTNLRHLDVSGNALSDFPALETMANLESVSLANNPIEVPREILVGPSLQMLNLRGTLRPEVPRFIGAVQLEAVQLSVSRRSAQVCAQFADLVDAGISVSVYFGADLIYCADVLCEGPYRLFPDANLFSILLDQADFDNDGKLCDVEIGHVIRLDVSNQGIRSLEGLANLYRLRELDCSQNQIEFLPDLSGLSDLTDLDCSQNRIRLLPDLRGLANLKSINCSGNQIESLTGLDGLSNLTALDCSHNEITQTAGLDGLTGLRSLDLSFNPLAQLDDLVALVSLDRLIATNAELTSVQSLPPNLYGLDLASNQITPSEFQLEIPDLSWLDLSDNQLVELPDLSSLRSLSSLYCSNNLLTYLPDLDSMPSLYSLYCSGNQLTDIASLGSLRYIDCSNNSLQDLPRFKSTWVGLINIRNNAFKSLSFLVGVEVINTLVASSNELTTVSELETIRCQRVDLSYNQLTEVPHFPLIRSLYNPDLDIRYNRLTDAQCDQIKGYWAHIPIYFEYSPQLGGEELDCAEGI